MDSDLLDEAIHRDKYILTEKELTFRTVREHQVQVPVYILDGPGSVKDFMGELFDKCPVETLYALALSSSNQFLGFLKLSQGTVDRAAVYPRGLLSFLLVETNATGVILTHNHPGGSAKASREDITLTRRLECLLRELDVRLLDHLIYAPGTLGKEPSWVSLREEGILE